MVRCARLGRKLLLLTGIGLLGFHATPAAAQTLVKSAICTVRGNGVTDASPGGAKPITRIRMKNDGGWCWSLFWAQVGMSKFLQANEYIITNPPRHGNVVLTDVENKHVQIAYHPEPGFFGTDSFVIHLKYIDVDSNYTVTVLR